MKIAAALCVSYRTVGRYSSLLRSEGRIPEPCGMLGSNLNKSGFATKDAST